MWGNSFDFWDNNFEGIEDLFGLFLSSEEVDIIISSLGSGLFFSFIKENEGSFTSSDSFFEVSLS